MDNNKNNGVSRKSTPTYDVYVGHVPKELNQKGKIEQIFSKYGALIDVLYRFGNGSYGYAIVKFKYQKDADAVLRNVDKINIGGYDMDVKKGKISNQSAENANGSSAICKTVTFAEPIVSIPPMENCHFMEPILFDPSYAAYVPNENGGEQFPIMVEIMCTNVENAVTFYGCVINRCDELRSLALKLNSICPNLQRLLRKPALRKVYGALFEDLSWYRCSVIQTTVPSKPGVCIVQYIDYGNIAEVCYTNVVELPEPLKNLTPFAIKCVFSNLMCTAKSHNNISYLHHLVNERMSLCALSAWGILEYQILKCSCKGIDVIAELVRNGFAVYRTQASIKSPPMSNRSNKVAISRSPENNKSKKAIKTHKKAGSVSNVDKKVKDVFNDNRAGNIGNSAVKSSEINNNEQVQNHGNAHKNLFDASQHTQNFVPKKIIKREVSLTTVPSFQEATAVNHLLKLDCVISNIKLVNSIRNLYPLHADDDDLINNAISLLQKEVNVIEESDAKSVEEAYQKYCDALNDLKECSDLVLLAGLKERRERQRIELFRELEKFFENFDYSLHQKRNKIQGTITALESYSNVWMNVYLSKHPNTLEDLLQEYNQEKEKKKNIIQKARENTNKKEEIFQNILHDLQRECSLNMADGNVDKIRSVSTGGKRGSWALKFEETLTELGNALEVESNTSTMVKDRNHKSVINYILEKLEVPKEKIDAECERFQKYESLRDDLNLTTADVNDTFEKWYGLQNDIKALRSNCVSNGDAEKMKNMLLKMHNVLLEKDALLLDIAKASAFHFPELTLEHPELKLDEFKKNLNLLKFGWEEKFFPHVEKCNRVEPSYISKLAEEPVVIKAFKISCNTEKKAFMKKAAAWNEIKSKYLVKIKAVFSNKDENILYAVVPPVWKTLYDEPLSVPVDNKIALNLLQQILVGLCDIHSRGIAHGVVHPIAILHNSGEILLDFNFDKKYLHNNFCLNGINFQVPCAEDLYKSADMYGFGCLVLWVLFPNLSFTSTDQGVPNLSSFQSIIQDLLSAKDFASLCALLNVNQDLRPSSRVLLSNGFLKDLRIMS